MIDGQSQTPKARSKGFLKAPENWLKKTFSRPHSRSTSPQPSAFGQEDLGGELSSVQHVTTSSGHQWIDPVIGASAALTQRDHRTPAQLSRSHPSSPSSGLPGSAVAHDQHITLTLDGAASVGPTQLHGTVGDLSETQAHPKKSTSRVLSTAKDIWSFTEMLLKRLPDAVDTNPAKIAVGIVKIVLQIKYEVKGNMDAVDQRILSTVDQLRTVEEALDGWEPNNPEEKQGIELYRTTLVKEWTNLIELKKQSLIRKIAVHEEDKGKIADIFERINGAREQLVVVTSLRVHKTVLAIQEDVAKLLLERLEASHAADHKSEMEGEQRQLRCAVCTSGARVRILGDIAKWANDTSSESQSAYWLSGHVGGSWGQSNWKWCNKCEGLTFAGGTGNCPAGGVHDHNGSGDYSLAHNDAVFQGQDGWKWCNKCQGICFTGSADLGPCPNGGKHDHTGSGNYKLALGKVGFWGQNQWKWCNKCQGLSFSGNSTQGSCPGGGVHDHGGSGDYTMVVNGSDIVSPSRGLRSNYTTGQRNWKWCNKCQGLAYSGSAVCPAGDVHDHSKSANYSLAWDGLGQTGWKWCTKCQSLSFTGTAGNVSTCPAGGVHDTNSSANYGLQLNNSKAEGQKDWKWCCKCQGLTFAASSTIGPCSVGGVHDHSGSGNYTLAWGASVGQDQWRWCSKCQGLAYDGYSVCAAGGAHTHVGSGDYSLPLDDPTASGQDKWKWCSKCYGLAYAGSPSLGPCPAKGNHDHCGSGNYTLLSGIGSDNGQNKWSWCNKCQLLAYSGNGVGPCPAGGNHDHAGSGDYTLAHAHS